MLGWSSLDLIHNVEKPADEIQSSPVLLISVMESYLVLLPDYLFLEGDIFVRHSRMFPFFTNEQNMKFHQS